MHTHQNPLILPVALSWWRVREGPSDRDSELLSPLSNVAMSALAASDETYPVTTTLSHSSYMLLKGNYSTPHSADSCSIFAAGPWSEVKCGEEEAPSLYMIADRWGSKWTLTNAMDLRCSDWFGH